MRIVDTMCHLRVRLAIYQIVIAGLVFCASAEACSVFIQPFYFSEVEGFVRARGYRSVEIVELPENDSVRTFRVDTENRPLAVRMIRPDQPPEEPVRPDTFKWIFGVMRDIADPYSLRVPFIFTVNGRPNAFAYVLSEGRNVGEFIHDASIPLRKRVELLHDFAIHAAEWVEMASRHNAVQVMSRGVYELVDGDNLPAVKSLSRFIVRHPNDPTLSWEIALHPEQFTFEMIDGNPVYTYQDLY